MTILSLSVDYNVAKLQRSRIVLGLLGISELHGGAMPRVSVCVQNLEDELCTAVRTLELMEGVAEMRARLTELLLTLIETKAPLSHDEMMRKAVDIFTRD